MGTTPGPGGDKRVDAYTYGIDVTSAEKAIMQRLTKLQGIYMQIMKTSG